MLLRCILILALCMSTLPSYSTGEGYSAVPMPGFFNPNSLRYKQALDAENGRVWIGMRDLGVLVWSNSVWTFWDPSNGCPDYNVTAVDLLPSGEAWVGCDTGGIGYFDGFGWNTFGTWNSPVPATSIRCIRKIGNDVWAGTENGLLLYDGVTWTQYTTQNSSLPSDTIHDIAPDGSGGIFIGSEQGFVHFNSNTFTDYWGNTSSDAVTDVHVNPAGDLYALSLGQLYRFSNSTWFDLNSNGVLNFPAHIYTGGRSMVHNAQGDIIANGINSSLYEVSARTSTVYYLSPALYCLAGYAVNILDNDDVTGEIWSVNVISNNAVLSNLHKLDLQGYNGLGKGSTPSNLKFLNANNTEACISNRGDMHFDYVGASYRAPKTQQASAIFISDLWISGLDSASNIHGAFQRYRQSQHNDFFPGPLDPLTGGTDSTIAWRFDRIWSVTQYEISEFQWNFAQGNVQNGTWLVPRDIEEWPARGNTNVNGELAPFVDVNANGIYDPLYGGDYPFIRGEQEMFWVFNDKLAPHSESTALPLGVQVNATARAYYCPGADDSVDLVNQVTVYEFDIINRSGSTYTDVVISWAQDPDLGNWADDYLGCDTMNNVGFTYNGDSLDETTSSYPAFGNHPPIAANMILSGPLAPGGDLLDNDHDGMIDEPGEQILLSGFRNFYTGQSGPTGMPLTPSAYFRYQRGYWQDSVPLTVGGNGYGGVTPTTYCYSGNPFDTSQWNEGSAGEVPGDRFMFLNCGPVTLYPGDTIHFSVAVMVLQDSSLSWRTQAYYDQLPQACAKVRNWHANDSWPGCGALYDDVEEPGNDPAQFKMYPNPASEQITLELPPLEDHASIVITDITGRVIYSEKTGDNARTTTIPVASFAAGVYFVTLYNGDHSATQKFIRN